MCAKLNKEQLDSLQYRASRLARLQARLTRLMSGEEASFLPLVRTKSGAHSEKKTRKLVEELIDALQRTERHGYHWMDRTTEEFYRAYLYCLLRLAAEGGDWAGTHGRFTDLIRLAEDTWPQDEVALHHQEEGPPYFQEINYASEFGFFAMMDALYKLSTESPITITFTDAENEALRRRYPFEEYDDLDLPDDYIEESFLEPDFEWDEEVLAAEAKYQDALEAELRQVQEKWKGFAEKDALFEAYRTVRKLYFTVAGDNMLPIPEQIRRMLTLYLAEHGQSLYTDDERFFAVYSELNKTVSSLQSQQKREG